MDKVGCEGWREGSNPSTKTKPATWVRIPSEFIRTATLGGTSNNPQETAKPSDFQCALEKLPGTVQ